LVSTAHDVAALDVETPDVVVAVTPSEEVVVALAAVVGDAESFELPQAARSDAPAAPKATMARRRDTLL
jgi:hypothetical protein